MPPPLAAVFGRVAAGWLPHPRRRTLFIMVIVALVVGTLWALVPATAYGAEIRQGDAVVVPPGETIDDDLYAFGQTVTIQGTINGDLIAAGQAVTVAGAVTGDVMAAGSNVIVSGPVGGSVRLAGQTVEIMAPVGGDVLAGAATLTVGPQARVERDLLAGSGTVTVGGPVGRSIRAGAETLTIAAPVGGDVLAQAGTLRLTSGASIMGSLTYTSGRDAVVEPGATVGGMTTRIETPAVPAEPTPAVQFGEAMLAWFRSLIGMTAYGLVLVLLFPLFSRRATDTLARDPWTSLGLGFAVLVGVPVSAVLLFGVGLLVGGWWIGPLALALYAAALPLGFVVLALYLGHLALLRAGRGDVATGWHLLAGLVLLGVVSVIPIAGGIVLLAALLFGLGAFVLALAGAYRGQPILAGEPVSALPHDHPHPHPGGTLVI